MNRRLILSVLLSGSLFPLLLPGALAAEPSSEAESACALPNVVKGAVGPFANYCDGYGNAGASGIGYISVLTLGTGRTKSDMDEVLNGIAAYDYAETADTYIGQINMIYASSFNGLNGAVWGYHVARSDSIANGTLKPLFTRKRDDGSDIPVYSAEPLLDAGRRLFGVTSQRRFPLLPGSHVICAAKEKTVPGPTVVWCAIGLAIAANRDKDSNLFIEDCGELSLKTSAEERTKYFDDLTHKIVECVMRCEKDNRTRYKEIFVGYQAEEVPQGEVGCALVAAPYVVLARNAIPKAGITTLLDMTLAGWEKSLSLKPLPAKDK